MKKIILLILIAFIVYNGFAQNELFKKITYQNDLKIKFADLDLFRVNTEFKSNVLTNYSSFFIKNDLLDEIKINQDQYIKIKIPYKNELLIALLYKVDILTDDFEIFTPNKSTSNKEMGTFYRGIIENDSSSIVSISFFKDDIIGFISNNKLGNLIIGKVNDSNFKNQYIIYNDKDLPVQNSFNCSTENNFNSVVPHNISNQRLLTGKCVRIYYEVDNNIYTQLGSNITNVTNWITAQHNNVATIYANDGINISLSSLFIWTVADSYNGTNTQAQLYLFRNTRTTFNGDVACLIGLDGFTGGIAFLNELCTNSNYAYADMISLNYTNVPNYSWQVNVISHEIGHVLASPHTHDCFWNGNNTAIDGCYSTTGGCPQPSLPNNGGTIMSYCHNTVVGMNFNNGFGPQPSNLIRNTINNASCLSPTCDYSCINATGFIIQPYEISATVSWNENVNTKKYNLRYRLKGTTVWKDTISYRSSINLINLICNTEYEFQVSSLCISGFQNSYSAIQTFKTTRCVCRFPTNYYPVGMGDKALLRWDYPQFASRFVVRYRMRDSINGIWNYVVSDSNKIWIYNIRCQTYYDWQVKSICNSIGDSSDFSSSQFLWTSGGDCMPCNYPTNTVSNPSQTSAELYWFGVNNSSLVSIRYRPLNGIWIDVDSLYSNENNSHRYIAKNLLCDTEYEWQIKSINCTYSPNSNYSESNYFKTKWCYCIIPPTNLLSLPLETSSYLSWNDYTDVAPRIVRYRKIGENWNFSETYYNSINITGLVCNTIYEWSVASVCQDGFDTSEYSILDTFSTLTSPNTNPFILSPPNNFIVNTDSIILSWSNTNPNLGYVLEVSENVNFTTATRIYSNGFSINGNQVYKTVKNLDLNNKTYYWRVKEKGDCSEYSTIHVFKTKNTTTSIGESIWDSKIIVSPNPTSGIVQIIFNEMNNQFEKYSISLINSFGQTLSIQNINKIEINIQSEINLANLPKGIYFIQIVFDNNVVTRKVERL